MREGTGGIGTMTDGKDNTALGSGLTANLDRLKQDFAYPANFALMIRELYISLFERKAAVIYLESAADTDEIEKRILTPLLSRTEAALQGRNPIDVIRLELVTSRSGKVVGSFGEIIEKVLSGSTILLVDGETQGLSFETSGFEVRQVAEPTIEHVIRGPKESFVESSTVNRSLIRKQLKDQNLIAEILTIGERTAHEVTVMYINDLANPDIVAEVKRRIQNIRVDAVLALPVLEQLIEERPFSLLPSALLTERPDRACAFLLEGHVILLMDNSPSALVVPITFWSLLHSAEDHYMRWAYAIFMRVTRLFALFVAVLTPSIYIAVSTFHEEMIPTDLLLAIAATREKVPFPALLEVLLMEFAFELVREAAIRVPTIIGPTIGIVGALILGQAAVEANIISPILVVIVALTGISSFTIPETSLNFTVRLTRFMLLFASAFMGFFGIGLVIACLLAYLSAYTSFGVPLLSPVAPHYRSSFDTILRKPTRLERIRPHNLKPQDTIRNRTPGRKSK